MKKFLALSSWSRKAAIGSMLIMAFAVVGCDDSSSASAGPNDETGVESSSSVEQGSSSSEKAKSSSSDTRSDANQSSSSEKTGKSSSSEGVLLSSSLERFDWNLPKESYLNSGIEYDTIIDSRDGKVYKTVKIGEQVWMAENLNYYDASDLSVKEKSWCFGTSDNKDSATCDVTGRLYTWAAAIDSVTLATDTERPRICGFDEECSLPDTVQGICPLGWHLPNKEEWKNLLTTIGGSETAGDMLKTTSGWINSWESTDAFGFSALPAGYRICEGDYCYFDLGFEAYFWSSTGYFDDHAYYINLRHYSRYSILTYRQKYYAFSVRCVKD